MRKSGPLRHEDKLISQTVQINEFATEMGAKKSRIAVPSRDKAIRGKSPSRCAAPSKGKDFHGKSPSLYAASSKGKDFHGKSPSLSAASSEDEHVYGEKFPYCPVVGSAGSSRKPSPQRYFPSRDYGSVDLSSAAADPVDTLEIYELPVPILPPRPPPSPPEKPT